MRGFKRFFIGVCLILISGCDAVYTTSPIGEKPLAISKKDWEGLWVDPDEALTIQVLNQEEGLIQIAWIDEDKDQLKLETRQVHLLESGKWVFANMQNGDGSRYYFFWGRVKKDPDRLMIWMPDISKMRHLVRQGLLPGKADNSQDVVLYELTTSHLELITSETEGVLFDWDRPIILTRLR